MDPYYMYKFAHIIGACVLLGTGAGIAFFMLVAHRTGKAALIAHVANTVVIADMIFTATAVVAQPITGVLLAREVGWDLTEGWIVLSLILYVVTGAFWLPVVWIQAQLRDMARIAAHGETPLPARYHRLWRVWFVFGFPAFGAVTAILWLMITRPEIVMF